MTNELQTELDAWVVSNWDPELSVREWWSRLAQKGLTNPALPAPFGRGWGRAEGRTLAAALREAGAVGSPAGLGMMLAGPTIVTHGTQEQVERFVPRILDGTESWCQLFSEPGAGSDLAGLQTKAELDGDEYVISGQKVWTSEGQYADWGMLLARTDPTAPKHRGISWFAFPMHQAGVEVRPLREMTGRALFNEVFIDEARVPVANLIGDAGDGWRVANTTLMVERAGIGGGSGTAYAAARPGTVAGDLDKEIGGFRKKRQALAAGSVGPGTWQHLVDEASARGPLDAATRQGLASLRSDLEVIRLSALRGRVASQRTAGDGNLAKLRMTTALRRSRALSAAAIGPQMMLWGKGTATDGVMQEATVFSPAPSIYGGTDEVQRNIIGERALGLPKEPGAAKSTPFSELPPNQ
ncbi:MAG: acyl-CoA dehydrogenase family protein [Acidimicrobiales bacterium]